jgi:hypothetical protein
MRRWPPFGAARVGEKLLAHIDVARDDDQCRWSLVHGRICPFVHTVLRL